MTRTRLVVIAAVTGAALAFVLLVSLPVVRWSLGLLALWAALTLGLACRSAWRTGAARWSWRLGAGLVRAGRGAARDVDGARVRPRRAVVQIVRAGSVLAGDRRVLVARCRQLSPGVRAALLVVALLVALVAVSACALVAACWCLRHARAGVQRVCEVLARALGRLEPTLGAAPAGARWIVS